METKICTKCNKEFPATIDFFSKCKKGKYGLNSTCKECRSEYNKQWFQNNKERKNECKKKWREENKEKHNEWTKQYCETNKEYISKQKKQYREKNKEHISEQKKEYDSRPEIKERRKEKGKIYNLTNKDKIKEYSKKYYQNNKEHKREYQRKYLRKNPQVNALHHQKRINLKHNLQVTLTLGQWEQIKTDFDYKCAYCGMSEKEHKNLFNESLHQEHFLALSNGGEFTHNNIIPACRSCNSSKNNKLFADWFREQPFYSKKREKFILDYLNYKDGKQQLTIAI